MEIKDQNMSQSKAVFTGRIGDEVTLEGLESCGVSLVLLNWPCVGLIFFAEGGLVGCPGGTLTQN